MSNKLEVVNERGQLHCDDGPAQIEENGTKRWFENGKLKYIEYPDGSKSWWKDDQLHREDGPAIIFANGHKVFSFHGNRILDENHELSNWLEENNIFSFPMTSEQLTLFKLRWLTG